MKRVHALAGASAILLLVATGLLVRSCRSGFSPTFGNQLGASRALGASEGTLLQTWPLGDRAILNLGLGGTGSQAAVTCVGRDGAGAILALDLGTGGSRILASGLPVGPEVVHRGAFDASLRFAAAWSSQVPGVGIYDLSSGALLRTLAMPENQGQDALAVDASGKRLACALQGPGGSVLSIWDTERGEEVARCPGHEGPVIALAFSPDGGRIVSGSRDGTLREWTLNGQGRILARNLKADPIAFSPDGKWLTAGNGGNLDGVVSAMDDVVHLWNASTGEPVQGLPGNLNGVNRLAWSGDSRLLAVACNDHVVRLWDVSKRRQLGTLPAVQKEGAGPTALAFLPGDRKLLCGSPDGAVRLWDVGPLLDAAPHSRR